jgi:DNA-binding MarR family transcriptional regulator
VSRDKRGVFEELLNEVRRSQNATARFDQAVSDALGLNRTDMRCIDALSREGSMTAGRLAEETGLSTGAMTTALDRLEAAGYAQRVRDPDDRRRVVVELTPRVHEIDSFYSKHLELSEQIYQRYTLAQLELLLGFVRDGREFNEHEAAALEERTRGRAAG